MSEPARAVPPLAAYQQALLVAGEKAASLSAMEVGLGPGAALSAFAGRFPARYLSLPPRGPEVVAAAVERSGGGGPVFLGAPVEFVLGEAYPALVRSLLLPRRNVKLVGVPPEPTLARERGPRPVRDDVGTMRSLPSMTVAVPADAPTVGGLTAALADREGPAYVRLPPGDAPPLTDGTFSFGRAHELRSGRDLTIVALGVMLSRAVEAADELARVGVSVRVLDVASVKPFDEAAVLRAARDTGAILVVEAAPVGTGIGTLVAAMTAENYPVPVRRLGLPDVWPEGDDTSRLDDYGLSLERVRDEAWELLGLRGRIH